MTGPDWNFRSEYASIAYCSLSLVLPPDSVALCYFDRKIRSQTIYFRMNCGINLCFQTKLHL
jgi:hypothetical protein